MLLKGIINEDIYKQQITDITSKKIELKETISKIENPNSSVVDAIDKVLNISNNSYRIFNSLRIEEKRRILKNVFLNFLWEEKIL